ncbi:MAG: prepilin-type N-terminal cleavage/methylation domain-containing protein [bacterium]
MTRKTESDCGFTLIEVVMAVFIAAIAVMAIFSVVLSSRVSGVKTDMREEGTMVMKHAAEMLKSYVSAQITPTEPVDPAPLDIDMPGNPPGHWSKDSSSIGSRRWALAQGTHDISDLLKDYPNAKLPLPPASSLTYTVEDKPGCKDSLTGGEDLSLICKKVEFTLTY